MTPVFMFSQENVKEREEGNGQKVPTGCHGVTGVEVRHA